MTSVSMWMMDSWLDVEYSDVCICSHAIEGVGILSSKLRKDGSLFGRYDRK